MEREPWMDYSKEELDEMGVDPTESLLETIQELEGELAKAEAEIHRLRGLDQRGRRADGRSDC